MLRVGSSFILGAIIGFVIFNQAIKSFIEPQVLGESVIAKEVTTTPSPTETPSPSPTPTPTPTPTATPTPKPTVKPTPIPTRVPQPVFTHTQINEFMERFGAQYVVDPNILRHIALCESEFRPNAVNGPYIGLFQFGSITWQNLRKAMGEDPSPDLRANAEEATQTAAYALSLGKIRIWPNCAP